MKKWEYKLIDSNDIKRDGLLKGRSRETIESYLGEIGAAGWEIVNMDFRELESRSSFTAIAKREKAG